MDKTRTARISGILYLILIIFGILNLIIIPSRLIIWDNAAETFDNIANAERLFRWGIAFGIITFLAFLLLPLALYKLLHSVSTAQAILMVIFAMVSIPVSFVNILSKYAVLTIISKPEFLNSLTVAELQGQAMFYLNLYNNGIELSQIFWGLWLFPFGYLVFKSGFLPKFFGIMLMAGCFGYLFEFLNQLLFPEFHNSTLSTLVGLPASIGEIGVCLWLLIMGPRKGIFKT